MDYPIMSIDKLIQVTKASPEYMTAVLEQAQSDSPVCPDKFSWIHDAFWHDVMVVKASEDCEVAPCIN